MQKYTCVHCVFCGGECSPPTKTTLTNCNTWISLMLQVYPTTSFTNILLFSCVVHDYLLERVNGAKKESINMIRSLCHNMNIKFNDRFVTPATHRCNCFENDCYCHTWCVVTEEQFITRYKVRLNA
jgi:hypothetical protein